MTTSPINMMRVLSTFGKNTEKILGVGATLVAPSNAFHPH